LTAELARIGQVLKREYDLKKNPEGHHLPERQIVKN